VGVAVNVTEATLSQRLKDEAHRLGFDLVGIAPAVSPPGYPRLLSWLERGFAGEMHYLPRRQQAYSHPEHVLVGVRSVVMVAMNYKTDATPTAVPESQAARVARYAQPARDYHDFLRTRLKELGDWLHEQTPGCRTRVVVDTAPILERDFARQAGLGWFGKNTLLIHKRAGSFLYLAGLLTDVALEPDEPHHTTHCGTCTRCLDVCPTQAFPEPYVLDATKCLAYFNIEMDGPIPHEHRSAMGNWLFGCDLCQDVCPWNRKAPTVTDPVVLSQPDLTPADALAIFTMNEADFKARFNGTPFDRPGWIGVRRSAAIVLGNLRCEAAVPALTAALLEENETIRDAAAWAIEQIRMNEPGAQATGALRHE
jgi:epoxyqueuosine reductase